YIRMDRVRQRPYQPVGDDKSIWILMDNGEVKEISESSTIVSSLIKGRNRHDNKLFFPKGI
ncbi:MAG: hypothetical protein QM266_05625, partial [Bacillota bacterium]|nr:hypothetical protein [Bacillota bacterium]